MIRLLNQWRWGGDPDACDPTSGLSLREIYMIQQTWAPVYARAAQNGVELFKRLFSAEPETRRFFRFIEDVDDDQLMTFAQFRAHGLNFLTSFNQAITHLRDSEMVNAMMNKLGESHSRRHVTRQHFNTLKEVLENYLKNDLHLKTNEIVVWSKFIDFIYSGIFIKL